MARPLSLVFLKPGKFFVVGFNEDHIIDFSVVDDALRGEIRVPLELSLYIPELFVPDSHCLLDVAVRMGLSSPIAVVILNRTSVMRKNGEWVLIRDEAFEVYPVKEESVSIAGVILAKLNFQIVILSRMSAITSTDRLAR